MLYHILPKVRTVSNCTIQSIPKTGKFLSLVTVQSTTKRMKNQIDINNDGSNVYATLHVKANPIGIILLMTLVAIVFAFFAALAWSAVEDAPVYIFPLLIIGALLAAFPGRYLIWNLAGKEHLIVNTKTISYHYNYGLFKTHMKTMGFHRLALGFEPEQSDKGHKKGNLIFYNYREDTGLPEVIHATTVLLEKEKIEELDSEIRRLFEKEYIETSPFMDFSLN